MSKHTEHSAPRHVDLSEHIIAPKTSFGRDPLGLSKALVQRLTGKLEHFSDELILPLGIMRPWPEGKQFGNTIMLYCIGCNANCAHCFDHEELLRAELDTPYMQRKKSELPGRLKGEFNHPVETILEEIRARYWSKPEFRNFKMIELTGGEITLWRGAILRFAELAKKGGYRVGVKTDGILPAMLDDYLNVFDGYQRTMDWFVSIKGTTAEEFSRHTGVSRKYHQTPFIAYHRLMEMGFKTYVGVQRDMLTVEGDIKQADNPVTRIAAWGIPLDTITWERTKTHIMTTHYEDAERKLLERGYRSMDERGKMISNMDGAATMRLVERLGDSWNDYDNSTALMRKALLDRPPVK